MCRNIRTLFNFAPPATDDEVRAAALQFVRKLSGYTRPAKTNEEAFNRAIDEIAAAAGRLLTDTARDGQEQRQPERKAPELARAWRPASYRHERPVQHQREPEWL